VEEIIQQRLAREKEAEKAAQRDKELEEETTRLEKEIEEEIRGVFGAAHWGCLLISVR
jgi:dynein intermediate chain